MRIIKKYQNRRLYDMTTKMYITLEDVKKLVIEHIPFQVQDARTKKDLTQAVLLQIIAEQETTRNPLFSTNLLQDFIRFYDKNSQGILTDYLEQMMKAFNEQRDFIQKQWDLYQKFMPNTNFFQQMFSQWQPKNKDEEKKR